MEAREAFSKAVITFPLVAITLLGLYATCVEPFRLNVAEWTVETPKWDGQPEIRIALISDVHIIRPWMTPAHLERIVRRANELKPDLILLLGDYVGTHPFGFQIDPGTGVAPFAKLSAPCGVYAVPGNHDIHGPPGWLEALAKTGVPVLQNKALPVVCGDQHFWVAGLEEMWRQHSDIGKTLAQVTNADPVILMTHQPDAFVKVPQSVALTVAGHTHGGQVRFPFIGAVEAVIPSRYGKRFIYGHIVEDGKDLVVSSGLGMTGLPIRFMTPPEITMITLKAP